MRNGLLWIHLGSAAVVAGATVLVLVQAAQFTPLSPEAFGAVRQVISVGARNVMLPALLLMVVSGMLLVVARPNLIDAHWVWAKAALGLLLAAWVLLHVYPATRAASALAGNEAAASVLQQGTHRGAAGQLSLDAALRREERGQWVVLVLLGLAAALAVWRPQLGRRQRQP